jgi:cytosine/adenosine deaminase-related metal-dependent hydrolase
MPDHAVDVSDGTITGVGRFPGYVDVIDLGNSVLMPQLSNVHLHPLDYFLMGTYGIHYIDDLVGAPYGIKYVELRKKSPEELRGGLRMIFRRMKKMGVGFILPIVEYGVRYVGVVVEEARSAGIITRPLAEPSSFRVYVHEEEEDDVDESFEEEVRLFVENGYWLSLVSPLNYTRAELTLASRIVSAGGGWLSTHVSETPDTHEDGDLVRLIETTMGMTLLVHLTQASRDELGMVRHLPLALCPRSNSILVNRLPPIGEMMELGIRPMLGTDNLALVEPNPLDEARYLYYASRVMGRPVEPRELLMMITTWAWGWGIGFNITEGQTMRGVAIGLAYNGVDVEGIHEYVLLRTNPGDIVAVIDGDEALRW